MEHNWDSDVPNCCCRFHTSSSGESLTLAESWNNKLQITKQQGDRNVECHTGIGIPRGGLAEVGGKYRKQGETELLDH
eukprot:1161026-Pelagomonas_calceolata.AAC.7